MVCLLGIAFLVKGPSDKDIVIALLTIGVGVNACTYLGFQVN